MERRSEIKELVYPFIYDEWLRHPRTKEALKIIKEDFKRLELEKQLQLIFI